MKNKLLILIGCIGMLLGSNAFAIPSPFIYEEDVIQATRIPGTEVGYCVSTVTGAYLALRDDEPYYTIEDPQKVFKDAKKLVKRYQRKYAKAKDPQKKANLLKKIAHVQKIVSGVKTCKKFNVNKLACEIATNKGVNKKIIGGAKCENQKKSAVAKIVISYENTKDEDLCTGTLIYPNAFLTAAHCFGEVGLSSTDNNQKVIGKLIKQIKVTIGGKTYKATGWTPNPFWNGVNEVADTAIVWIDKNVNKTPFKLIKKNYEPQVGDFAAIIGYGAVKFNKKGKAVNGYAGGFVTVAYADPDSIFTVYQKGTNQATSCFGDSGGPMISWIDGAWRILGTITGGDDATGFCGTKTGVQNAAFSRINSPENIQFLEEQIPGIFE